VLHLNQDQQTPFDKKMKKMTNIILILFLSICTGCHSINKDSIALSVQNPTSFTFRTNIDSIKSIIYNNFGNEQYFGYTLFDKHDFLSKDENIFKLDSNYNDFVLEEFINYHKYFSKIYFRKSGKAYSYCASYHIHLKKVDDFTTTITILTFKSEILKGLSKLPVLPHFSRKWVYIDVKPTTVEEYEILQIIGKALGIKDMPPIKIPEKVII